MGTAGELLLATGNATRSVVHNPRNTRARGQDDGSSKQTPSNYHTYGAAASAWHMPCRYVVPWLWWPRHQHMCRATRVVVLPTACYTCIHHPWSIHCLICVGMYVSAFGTSTISSYLCAINIRRTPWNGSCLTKLGDVRLIAWESFIQRLNLAGQSCQSLHHRLKLADLMMNEVFTPLAVPTVSTTWARAWATICT